MMDSADEKYLHQLYYNPKHSTAFSSASKRWQYIKLHGRNITRKQLYEWLSKTRCVYFPSPNTTPLGQKKSNNKRVK